jgi:preprotein translocase subunit YajC
VVKHSISVAALLTVLLVGLIHLTGCAPAPSGQTPSSTGFDWTFVVFVLIIALAFYLFTIRPQRKRQDQQRKLLSGLNPGDQVITAGGIFGQVESLDEESVVLKVESGAKIRVARQSIAGKRS